MLAGDIVPHGYQRSYREALDEGLRSFYGDQEPVDPETQSFYKRSNGLKYIGLGKRGQNGQKKKNSGMKYIGLGKRDY